MGSASQTFLIVHAAETKDFLQLTASPDGAQIDFPLITDRQRALEPRIREAARELRLDFRETQGAKEAVLWIATSQVHLSKSQTPAVSC